MSDDSSYDNISLVNLQPDEVASGNGEPKPVETNEDTPKILFELPDSLLQDSSPPVNNEYSSPPSCASSSYVPVKALKNLQVCDTTSISDATGSLRREATHDSKAQVSTINHSNGDSERDGNDDESWSHISLASTWKSSSLEEASIAASSTISGFDLISLSGESKRRCQRCSFLNKDEGGICGGCERALLANPCLDLDGLLAQQMVFQEEERELLRLIQNENKRKFIWSEPLLHQAQALADDVVQYFESSHIVKMEESKLGLCMVPPVSLTILASRFIECILEAGCPAQCEISVRFHFSPKFMRGMTSIHADGLGSDAAFSKNPHAALVAAGGPSRKELKKVAQARKNLPTIPETNTEYSDRPPIDPPGHGGRPLPLIVERMPRTEPKDSASFLGWIAATASWDSSDTFDIDYEEQSAIVKLQRSTQSLPLASFDATLMNNPAIQRRFRGTFSDQTCHRFLCSNTSPSRSFAKQRLCLLLCAGLAQMCNDFFLHIADSPNDNDSQAPYKKLKMSAAFDAINTHSADSCKGNDALPASMNEMDDALAQAFGAINTHETELDDALTQAFGEIDAQEDIDDGTGTALVVRPRNRHQQQLGLSESEVGELALWWDFDLDPLLDL
jgi:hypothetical protein